jgi:GTP-binding protein
MSVVALIGRPNVGKSTLFNRLTQSKHALVADEPGLTRDRQYGIARNGDKQFIVIDTGGIGIEDEVADAMMIKQSLAASEEADVILFIVDAHAALTPLDTQIANALRHREKVIVVVNKIDGIDEDVALSDFYSLGFAELFAISANRGRGVKKLIDSCSQHFPAEIAENTVDAQGTRIAVIGRPNVGKSTLINRVLGEERVVALDKPGTTRDSIFIPFKKQDKEYTLIDTAGIRKKSRINEKIEKFSVVKALEAIHNSHVCLVVFDAQEGVVEQDMHLIRFVMDAGKGLILLVNKWDGMSEEDKEHVKTTIDRRLVFASFASIHFISAKHGTGVGKILSVVDKVYHSATKPLSTSKLTSVLEKATQQHPPPLISGRRVKLKYAHAAGHNPPLIVIHGNQTSKIPEQYQRYLVSVFRKAFDLVGTPIQLSFKDSDNPYKDKKNVLTDSQRRKRNRMIKRHKKK